MNTLEKNLHELVELISNLRSDLVSLTNYDAIVMCLSEAISAGKKILIAGNGGSMADAMHFAEELSGNFREKRKALPAIAFSDPSVLTCISNDFSFEELFSRQVEAIGNGGDCLFLLSASGRSANLNKAAEVAREMGIVVISLTGDVDSPLQANSDFNISVGSSRWADRVQEIQKVVIHSIVQGIESELFPTN